MAASPSNSSFPQNEVAPVLNPAERTPFRQVDEYGDIWVDDVKVSFASPVALMRRQDAARAKERARLDTLGRLDPENFHIDEDGNELATGSALLSDLASKINGFPTPEVLAVLDKPEEQCPTPRKSPVGTWMRNVISGVRSVLRMRGTPKTK